MIFGLLDNLYVELTQDIGDRRAAISQIGENTGIGIKRGISGNRILTVAAIYNDSSWFIPQVNPDCLSGTMSLRNQLFLECL